MFYADTALFGAYDATVCGLGFFGADHVLFASDAPFDPEKGPMYIRETIAIVDRLPITTDERERIYWRNFAERRDGRNQPGACTSAVDLGAVLRTLERAAA